MTGSTPPRPQPGPKPAWLRVRLPADEAYFSVSALLEQRGLHTICRSARCPNIGECWAKKTATFLILGDVCTRACAFCAVGKGRPKPPAPDEPERVADAAALLGLKYAVVTSVTRDDLPDGGASHFVATAAALRRRLPGIRVELLIPDFNGDPSALETALAARPDILNHNLETTETLYPLLRRPAAGYRRSLEVLRRASGRGFAVKSGLMVGLGETMDDLFRAFRDLREAGCLLLTIGQYLQPSAAHVPVARYYTPGEFDGLKERALAEGFAGVESGPLVRSSYHAHSLQDAFARRLKDASCAH
ncbi:MAG: lipoyl synthase [Candidatus Aminicenantes bacterium]|nr:lipoyl synthase [Candidatus Aminicenantes bacterium]